MKYLFLLLFSLSVHASIESRLDKIDDLRLAMSLCGYDYPNMELFKHEIKANNDTVKMDCLESKKNEVKTEIEKGKKEEDLKNCKILLKSVDEDNIGSTGALIRCFVILNK